MKKILIIDDDDELCELVTEYLTVEGFGVEAVHDGESGLSLAAKEEHDMVILDVMLPKKNGIEVLKRSAKSFEDPGFDVDGARRRYGANCRVEIGADDYMPKPFNPRELAARLRAILRRTEASKITLAGGKLSL